MLAYRRIFGSGDCPVRPLARRDLKPYRSCVIGAAKKAQSPLFAMPPDAQLKPGASTPTDHRSPLTALLACGTLGADGVPGVPGVDAVDQR